MKARKFIMKSVLQKTIKGDEYGVTALDGIPVVSSRLIAEKFEKEHKVVLRSIRNVECSDDFRRNNFVPSTYKNSQNKTQTEYLLTKDGFAFIIMGFTGKRAAQFKEAYINKFNEMEKFIKEREIARLEYPELTMMIKQSHENPKFFHYSNEADMINSIVLGMKSKQFKELHGLKKSDAIRDYMTSWQIEAIQKLQKVDVGLIPAISDMKERKRILESYYNTLIKTLEFPKYIN